MDDFWRKWQAYSLTFWPKYGVFGRLLIWTSKRRKMKMEDFLQKCQAYSLTFWPKYGVFGRVLICARK